MFQFSTKFVKDCWLSSIATLLLGVFLMQLIIPLAVWADDTVVDVEENVSEASEPEPASPTPEADSSDEAESETPDTAATESESTDPPDTTQINTGDAESGLTSDTEINTNVTNIDTEAEVDQTESAASSTPHADPEIKSPTASSSPDSASTSPAFGFATNLATSSEETVGLDLQTATTADVSNENTATLTTNATSTAATGENEASGSTDVMIETGNAVAYADVLNVVNTNLTNSDGLIDFFNTTLGYENFDLRNEFETVFADGGTAQTTPACNLDTCSDTGVYTTVNTNDATINNNITVVANTGNNQAAGASATVSTGNAYASANVINVANTNITDSNYLLLVFNNFSDYAGNIVLPGSSFFDQMLTSGQTTGGATVANTNNATINNHLTVNADTGHNASNGDTSTINTGHASANGTIQNTINQNFLNTNSFSMLVRVQGDWTGDIYGLPAGMSWTRTADGVRIFSTPTTDGSGSGFTGTVTNTNNATINNNVQVFALTGDNQATGTNAVINTGNAQAEASILNLANTNIVGSNWSNLIFTIYGDWNGNLTFGQPDLWLGLRVTAPADIMPGSIITYTYTIFNQGDTMADDVVITNEFPTSLLNFDLGTNPAAPDRWHIGDMEPGETREISYQARVSSTLQEYIETTIPLRATVHSQTPDANMDDNTDELAIVVGDEPSSSEKTSTSPTFAAKFDIEKTASRDYAQPGDTVEYSVTFHNRGGQLFDAALVDILEDETGNVLKEQVWPLDTIYNGETITIDYSIEYPSDIPSGLYRNTAQVVGLHKSRKGKYQEGYSSYIAEHNLQIGTSVGEILGASTCIPLLTHYLKYGESNDAEDVRDLQQFLNDHMGSNLPVTGYFDLDTEIAVRDFQQRYRDEILTPWGLDNDSGYVYYTTQKKINDIHCAGTIQFPLTQVQQKEITDFRLQSIYTAIMPREDETTLALEDSDPEPPEPLPLPPEPLVQVPDYQPAPAVTESGPNPQPISQIESAYQWIKSLWTPFVSQR